MNLPRGQRGFSLLEVAIASFLFALLSVVFFLTMRQNRAAESQQNIQTAANRTMLSVVAFLREELRGVNILQPSLPTDPDDPPLPAINFIEYEYPTMTEGGLVVTSAGAPVWAGIATIDYQDNRLVRTKNSETSLLGSLGPSGEFSARRENDLVHVTIVYDADLGAQGRRSQNVSFYSPTP